MSEEHSLHAFTSSHPIFFVKWLSDDDDDDDDDDDPNHHHHHH